MFLFTGTRLEKQNHRGAKSLLYQEQYFFIFIAYC